MGFGFVRAWWARILKEYTRGPAAGGIASHGVMYES